ncbi:MAG TPA: hypothetical protein EYP18_02120 [Desulfobacterales bacterium]|nr:hypothetical protein [Desulfobacterales bacterium]
MFLVAGISQVPACYATKLDCDFKAKTSCPMVEAKQMSTADTSMSCPLLIEGAKKQKSAASFPLDRLKRLKIEQIQHDTLLLPSFTPGLISNIIIEQPETYLAKTLFSHRFDNPNHRPPPLFIQHQSFLI